MFLKDKLKPTYIDVYKRQVRGSEKLLEEFKRVLGIEVGDTTPDGKFSLDCLRCVGAVSYTHLLLIYHVSN